MKIKQAMQAYLGRFLHLDKECEDSPRGILETLIDLIYVGNGGQRSFNKNPHLKEELRDAQPTGGFRPTPRNPHSPNKAASLLLSDADDDWRAHDGRKDSNRHKSTRINENWK
jgi:hypothetical protein